jgi:hypothetical protein
MKITAESEDKKTSHITYNIEIRGPDGFSNKDITLRWNDTDGHSFAIGYGGSQSFKGTKILRWQSAVCIFKGKQSNNITLVLSFMTTARLGKYSGAIKIAET